MIFTIHFGGVFLLFLETQTPIWWFGCSPTFRSMAMMPFVTNSCVFFVMLSFHCSCVFFVIFVQDIVQTVEDLIFEMGHSVCFKRGRGGTSTDLKSECS